MNDPVILAIDPAVRRLGWCLAQGQRHVASGVLDLMGGEKKVDIWVRTGRLRRWLDRHLAQWRPDVIVVEWPTGDRGNMKTNVKLGMALGVIGSAASWFNVPVLEVHPTQVQATGFHKRDRASAALLIGVPLAEMPKDRADALGVWQAGLVVLREVQIGG